jgi:hypothetical protein
MLSTALKVNGDNFDAAGLTLPATSPAIPPRSRRHQQLAAAPLSIASECSREVQVAKKGRLTETGARRARGCEPRASAVQPTRRGPKDLSQNPARDLRPARLEPERHFGPAQDHLAVEKFEHWSLVCTRLIISDRRRSDDQVAAVVKGDRKR